MESQGIAQHYSQIEKIDLQMQQTAHKKQLLYLIKRQNPSPYIRQL